MAWFIAENGKTVHTWELTKTGIVLNTGREIREEDLGESLAIFGTDPEENPFLLKDENGIWSYSTDGEWIGVRYLSTFVPNPNAKRQTLKR